MQLNNSNDVPIWDLREETINKGWGKILVGVILMNWRLSVMIRFR